VVHEFGHLIFCWLAGVKVHQIKLFQLGKTTAGFVIHDEPSKFYQAILISFGPLILNSLLALLCFSQFKPPYYQWPLFIYLWLGIAVGLHAIPSTGDAKSLLQTTNHRIWRNPLILIGYPFVLFLYFLNLLRRIHFDFVYVAALFWLSNWYLKG